MKNRKNHIRKSSLVNTIRVTSVEYVNIFLAGNTQVYTIGGPIIQNAVVTLQKDIHATLKKIITVISQRCPYKIRFVHEYRHIRTGRVLQRKRTKYYYVFGKVSTKNEAIKELMAISLEAIACIRAVPGEFVFYIQQHVEPISKASDYSYLQFV